MSKPNQRLMLAADRIRDQLLTRRRQNFKRARDRLAHFTDRVGQLEPFVRKLSVCESRGWDAAWAEIVKRAETCLDELPYLIRDVEEAIKRCNATAPSLRDVYQELVQTDEEFDGLRYSREDDTLSVTTEPIELEGVYLGEFEIRLHVSWLGDLRCSSAIAVVAMDPHPAAGNESVTHPHVNGERLCTGDGDSAIHHALADGRICDFFTLVHAILNTYNSSSPYARLSDWEGRTCAECGSSASEIYYCHLCDSEVCEDCAYSCSACEATACPGCIQTCPVCDRWVCQRCFAECPDCGDILCSSCFEDGCPCKEKEDEATNEQESPTDACQARPA